MTDTRPKRRRSDEQIAKKRDKVGLHGSKNSCPNPKETRNVLNRTDPDPSIISKAGPGPVQIREMPNWTRPGPVYYLKAGPETDGKTQTRLDPIVTYSTLNCYYKSINLLRKIQLFVLPNLRSCGSVVSLPCNVNVT